jgi:D-alanyl-D-alanine carboxypeptidase/D-alanyl-D-alanine-endopeptidase (penicillin-binding protein 4)
MVIMRHRLPRSAAFRSGGAALVLGLVIAPLAVAGSAVAAPDPALDGLLAKRLDNPRLGSHVGLVVMDAATGEVLSDHGANEPLLTASNMKIVTAVSALATMPPETRFTTKVRAGAAPADLVLQGGGDPLLSTKDLQKLAKQVATTLPAGTAVTVHVDDSLFPTTGRARGWPAQYIPSVAAPVQALARIWDYSHDPSANAATVFAKELTARGLVAAVGEDASAGEAPVLAESEGHTLGDAVRVMLSISENNVAEVLHRHVAIAAGQPATWAGAQAATEQVLRNLGVDPTGMALMDGSGLSRKNRVSPTLLANVLRVARVTNPGPFTTMFEDGAMPLAGKSGTLDDHYGRFVTKHARCAQGAVKAKTGTLFDTIGLSGIAQRADGTERIFSILVNDRPQRFSELSTRQAVDGLAATVVGCWN